MSPINSMRISYSAIALIVFITSIISNSLSTKNNIMTALFGEVVIAQVTKFDANSFSYEYPKGNQTVRITEPQRKDKTQTINDFKKIKVKVYGKYRPIHFEFGDDFRGKIAFYCFLGAFVLLVLLVRKNGWFVPTKEAKTTE